MKEGGREMAWSIKCVLYEQEDLSLHPRIHIKTLMWQYMPVTVGLGQTGGVTGSLKFISFRLKGWKTSKERHATSTSGSMCTCTYIHTCARTHNEKSRYKLDNLSN